VRVDDTKSSATASLNIFNINQNINMFKKAVALLLVSSTLTQALA
jgi:hypothetical protein